MKALACGFTNKTTKSKWLKIETQKAGIENNTFFLKFIKNIVTF